MIENTTPTSSVQHRFSKDQKLDFYCEEILDNRSNRQHFVHVCDPRIENFAQSLSTPSLLLNTVIDH